MLLLVKPMQMRASVRSGTRYVAATATTIAKDTAESYAAY